MSDHPRDGPGPAAPHRVGRLRFELDGADEAALLRLRGALVGGADSWVPAALDEAFRGLDSPGRTLRLDRLEVDLGVLPESGFDPARLTEALRAALAERLRAAPEGAAAPPQVQAEDQTLAAALRHFLLTGRLPWWSPAGSLAALEDSLARLDAEALRELARGLAAVLAQPRAARRLVLQVTPAIARRLAAALPAARPGDFTAAAWPKLTDSEAVAGLVSRLRRVARASWAGGQTRETSEARRAADEAARSDPPSPREAARRETQERPEADVVDDALDIAVADAGLVLLHPFLPALFEARGLAAAGAFPGEAEQLRAVQLTAALAAGDVAREEPDMIMAKLLCGWPLDEPLPRDTALSAEDRAEGEALLRAAVAHWTALGQASPAALRETFLTRPGRLRAREDAWELEVERRGADVLLERLPWALSLVRLPWMPRPLQVIWC